MAWIDQNGDVRPQSWEEYCEMVAQAPDWPTTQTLMQRYGKPSFYKTRTQRQAASDRRVPKMRARLYRANPHCFWCGRNVTLEYDPPNRPDLATIDHLYSRLHPERERQHHEQKNVLHVLACRECNQERSVCEQRGLLFTPKLPERLAFARRADAALANRSPKGTAGGEIPIRTAEPPQKHPSIVLTLAEEHDRECHRKHVRRTPICTLKEAVAFAQEHPSR